MSHKIAQIQSELNKAISKVLQTKISDPRIRGMISITRMKVTKDMKQALVHVSVLPKEYQNLTVDGLNHARVHIQHLVRNEVALRIVPHFEFRLDESLKKQAEIFTAINEGMEKTSENEEENGVEDVVEQDETGEQAE
ncbi:Ribosome-binding factor A [Poriferisphaera corsica]|uniref:Ribosome-binding factor A n=1 Tax=Poriferisphaera corsica TaxID=2528020 RepID=A0A517YRU6_9BACT|nr:30S ribosome-binding factor RbfA [Poriferisphaera corsica]QDU32938.1 Ribosome-binding factor A [Poriferisphaera corsica]